MFLNCYSDAAWDSISLVAGLASVFRSNTDSWPPSEVIEDFSTVRTQVGSALEAEAWAVLATLSHAQTLGLDAVHFFSDCQILVNLLNSDNIHIEIYPILCDIRYLCLSFSLVVFSFIPRIENCKTDALAKLALEAFVRNHVP